MTTTPAPNPNANAIMRSTLVWSLVIEAVLAVVGAGIGYLVAGVDGVWSALLGVLMAAVFFGLTVVTMIVGARIGGGQLTTGYFAIVMGGWFVKVILFFVVLLVLRGQPWVVPYVFLVSALAGVLASLIVDLVVFARARVPYVGEVALPTENPEDSPRDDRSGS